MTYMRGLLVASSAAAFALGALRADAAMPTPDHVVLVIMENQRFGAIIGSGNAPYINSLAEIGALFTKSYGVTHPSQPNYLWLFSGSSQGITDNSCPHTFTTVNLARALVSNAWSFAGYAQGLPSQGSTTCSSGRYVRRHNPVADFSNVSSNLNKPFSAFPSDYTKLPTVAWVVPDLDNDMHDGTVAQGDAWLEQNLGPYTDWALSNNSLLILTWDEDDDSANNHVATLFVGSMVEPGTYTEKIDHVDVLRTVEDMYGLPYAGASNTATPITDVWNTCGDGVVDAGEQCGEPGLGCSFDQTCRSCVCDSAPACESDIHFLSQSLSMTASPFSLAIRASAVMPRPWVGVDPAANGIRIVVDEPTGTGGIDATLPAGSQWRVNGRGTRWRYADALGAVAGITKVSVSDQSRRRDGLLRIRVRGRGRGAAAELPDPSQTQLSVVFGTTDECATASATDSSMSCSGDAQRIVCN